MVMRLLGWAKLATAELRAWADPLTALAFVPLAVREGLEGWRGQAHEPD
jgi:hypothetical protein